jgi:hypothetical protein
MAAPREEHQAVADRRSARVPSQNPECVGIILAWTTWISGQALLFLRRRALSEAAVICSMRESKYCSSGPDSAAEAARAERNFVTRKSAILPGSASVGTHQNFGPFTQA